MKRLVYAGKIEKGQLVKCKLDTRFYMASHIEAMRLMQKAMPICIEMQIPLNTAGDNHVPGSHS